MRRTREAVEILERILSSIESDREKMHPTWYEIQKEPVIEQLAELQAEIDPYLRTSTADADDRELLDRILKEEFREVFGVEMQTKQKAFILAE